MLWVKLQLKTANEQKNQYKSLNFTKINQNFLTRKKLGRLEHCFLQISKRPLVRFKL